jgi:hypothetical protein
MNAPVSTLGRDPAQPRHDWTLEEVEALFELTFTELVFRAAEVHHEAMPSISSRPSSRTIWQPSVRITGRGGGAVFIWQ